MFGWFRKRQRPEAAAKDAPTAQPLENAPEAAPSAATSPDQESAQQDSPVQDSAQQGSALRDSALQGSAPLIPEHPVVTQPIATQQAAIEPAAIEPAAASASTARATAAQPGASQTAPPNAAAPSPRDAARRSAFASPVAAPSLRPAMPLSDNPNFAGFGLAQPDLTPPRLLDPEAALSDEARDELTTLLLDMFGPSGRYRLEWRADREPGDDAMFSQIMVADLVRRIQNSIAIASDLELRAAPLRLAIEAMDARAAALLRDADEDSDSDSDDDSDTSEGERAEATEGADVPSAVGAPGASGDAGADIERDVRSIVDHRDAAITAVLPARDGLEHLAASAEPDRARPHHDTHDVEGDRRIA